MAENVVIRQGVIHISSGLLADQASERALYERLTRGEVPPRQPRKRFRKVRK